MFIDSHCHLDFPCFDKERDSLFQKLEKKQIDKLIIPATQKNSWPAILQLSASHKNLYYALGVHPHFLEAFQEDELLVLTHLLENRSKRCVAVGEIGLDKFAPADSELQEDIFIKQLQIAQKFDLPIILHVVKRQSRVLEILKAQKFTQGGVYHAFSGSYEIAMAFFKLGFKFGIGGVITYPNSIKTRQTISRLPVESLLLETDAPDMPVYQQQQQYNSPINLLQIFESLLQIRAESKNSLAAQIYQNTQCIFSLNND
ncbi:MAG: TatD family hydrolase [Psychromonas sp.]|nr:TatD family hydrolase [Psychromonas sp.]